MFFGAIIFAFEMSYVVIPVVQPLNRQLVYIPTFRQSFHYIFYADQENRQNKQTNTKNPVLKKHVKTQLKKTCKNQAEKTCKNQARKTKKNSRKYFMYTNHLNHTWHCNL